MWLLNGKKSEVSNARLENRAVRALGAAIRFKKPNITASPLILASPHSGRVYPEAFLQMSKLSPDQLRIGEDAYVDELIAPLAQFGIPVLSADFPRCFVDVNRAPDEIPPEYEPKTFKSKTPISSRARAGLGVVPSKIAQNLEIYKKPLTPAQVKVRIDRFYRPYHEKLTKLLNEAQHRCGRALLIDCHSMPGRGPNGEKRADIILGDRFGRSCRPDITTHFEQIFRSLGYSVIRNHPYAGGYVTHYYGNPDMKVDAIQIEINKDLYLNSATMEPHAGMKLLQSNFEKAILRVLERIEPVVDIAAQ